MNEQEAFRQADDTNVWARVQELEERIQQLEVELAEAKQKLEMTDVCWHCNAVLEPELPHCHGCPESVEDCDVYEHCTQPGCVEFRARNG